MDRSIYMLVWAEAELQREQRLRKREPWHHTRDQVRWQRGRLPRVAHAVQQGLQRRVTALLEAGKPAQPAEELW